MEVKKLMIKKLSLLLAFALVMGVASSADALLIDRGGGMIYSTGMDITILKDANLAMTSGDDADGLMTWDQANTWAQNLSHGGYDDWRLPTFDPDYNRESAAHPDNLETAADLSELAYLRYVELGPAYDDPGFDPAPFMNLGVSGGEQMEPWYWSGTLDALSPELDVWRFDFW